MNDAFEKLPCCPGDFYLPCAQLDASVFSVIACDQYTAQKEKWEEMERLVGAQPSTLRMIIPECYLSQSDVRVPKVQAAMRTYLADGTLEKQVKSGMVLVARTTQSGTRLGLVMMVDLEAYSFDKNAGSRIRPTEGTIVERIPPRQKVRRGAALELSHILLLCDDAKRTVIEPVFAKRDALKPLYDIDLMLGGGRVQGWAVEDEEMLHSIAHALTALEDALPPNGILFAVGDGNHSLATAKEHWREIKKTLSPKEQATHPARFATVELNNVYDNALVFEPIHRVLFHVTGDEVLKMLQNAQLTNDESAAPDITLVTRRGDLPMRIGHPTHFLPVGTVQACLDAVPDLQMDFVHGEDAVRMLVEKENAVGILLPAMDKKSLFPAVEASGALPRKTFSMGEACEKRYYLEARKIVED